MYCLRVLLLYFITGKFDKCMESKQTPETTEGDHPQLFRDCMYAMAGVDECGTWGQGCAPTLSMLRKSAIPKREFGTERFGETYPPTGHPRPDTSVCTGYKIWD